MAYGDYGRTTELEAVNTCLSIIGEQPVNSLDLSGVTKASLARDLIYNTSRRIQSEGLNCNTEITELTPTVEDKISLPTNCISVEPVALTDNRYIERDGQLYDRVSNSYTIEAPVTVKITYFLEWTELPEHVRNYISIVAARIFQARYVSDEALHTFSEMDELKAQMKFARLELSSSDILGSDRTFARSEELEVVNLCLDSIRETPQNSLTSLGTDKARFAKTLLHNTSRWVQSQKLNCNTARGVELEPDENSEIVLDSNVLDITPLHLIDYDLVEYDGKLYDQANQTTLITRKVCVDITYFLEWSELPEHVREYIKIRTIRLFQKKFLPDIRLHTYTEEDEYQAKAIFLRKEYHNAAVSFLDNTRINPRFYNRR